MLLVPFPPPPPVSVSVSRGPPPPLRGTTLREVVVSALDQLLDKDRYTFVQHLQSMEEEVCRRNKPLHEATPMNPVSHIIIVNEADQRKRGQIREVLRRIRCTMPNAPLVLSPLWLLATRARLQMAPMHLFPWDSFSPGLTFRCEYAYFDFIHWEFLEAQTNELGAKHEKFRVAFASKSEAINVDDDDDDIIQTRHQTRRLRRTVVNVGHRRSHGSVFRCGMEMTVLHYNEGDVGRIPQDADLRSVEGRIRELTV